MTKGRVFRRMVFAGILVFFWGFFVKYVSALTYQSSVDVRFTFDPTISLSVGGNLLINNLTPGNSSDSNIIDVAVSTNASYGYVLSATVGQKNGTDSLVNTSNNTYSFTNLSTTAGSAATLSNFADNKWGYSYSVDNGTNWISGSVGSTASGYAGLPLDNNDNAEDRGLGGVTLIDTQNPADNQTIKFKIGAKAANDQAAGTYSNTINFYAVAHEIPVTISDLTYLQEYGYLSDYNKTNVRNSMTLDTQYTIKDSRDQQDYTIAKLSDGNVWMTKNMNIAGGSILTPADSSVSDEQTLPASSANGFSGGSSILYVYNSNSTTCSISSPCYSYYSYAAASKICPKGWKLPTYSNFNSLINIYPTGPALTAAPFYGVYSGVFTDRGHGPTTVSSGSLWSSSTKTNAGAKYYLDFRSNSATLSAYTDSYGHAVRCIAN